ncbi:MAG TPA: hypothetical protein ENG51_05630 [Deltaproteobacteria bacterium]|nr:MAG: hypothetical protein DRG83_14390 [Deltaproteobacteria bacterium]HDM75936.1 hypothetical protein [Deltaproteobacteria bacterium]
MEKWKPIEIPKLKTVSIKDRRSKVALDNLGKPWRSGESLQVFLSSLPDVLAARDLREVVQSIVRARKNGRPVILGMGAHPIKVGLSPIIINLMSRGVITGIALNGAGIIHDFELAYAGKTSEIVEDVISDGSFGMTKETAEFLNAAIRKGFDEGIGLGEAVGREIVSSSFPHKDLSILASGVRLDVPVTVHVAVGTDVIHMHPQADGAAIGACSLRDFRIFARLISELEGGVYINLGSAVILPEVFLKAVSLVRNLGYTLDRFTTLNMDFKSHYRPQVNVVNRPPGTGGKGYNIIGHHEIMFPLLAALVIEKLEREQG